jgi:iron complex outermembrane recepter protein
MLKQLKLPKGFYRGALAFPVAWSIAAPQGALAQCRASGQDHQGIKAPASGYVSGDSTGEDLPADLTQVDLKQLLNFDIEVTSPSRKKQKISDVPSAIFVLSGDDIRRSGSNHIADALRMVPGLNVAQVSENQWAITARGHNNTFARHLLVLLDGQSIFTPMFNGVFWDQFELDLDDIDRVEVIRGPGAAVWGSNAVNGVINIITCSAHETVGNRVSAGGGSSERVLLDAKHGGKTSEDTSYRVAARYVDRTDNGKVVGGNAQDSYRIASNSMRLDSKLTKKDSLSVSSYNFFGSKDLQVDVPSLQEPFIDSESFSGEKDQYGSNIVARLDRANGERESSFIQADYAFERQSGKIFPLYRHTLHTEGQQRIQIFDGHDFIYGLGYRLNEDTLYGNFADALIPEHRSTYLFNGYVSDDIAVVPDLLQLQLGAKVENNTYTQFEFMPNIRLSLHASDSTSIWAAVSRAVANPSRVFDDIEYPASASRDPNTGLVVLPTLFGSGEIESENLIAYESGIRSQLSKTVSLDVAFFYNEYGDYQTLETGTPFVAVPRDQTQPAIIVPLIFANGFELNTYGGEATVSWSPLQWWKVSSSYSHLQFDLSRGNSTDVVNEGFYTGASPKHQGTMRSFVNVTDTVELDTLWRYVAGLDYRDIDGYFEMDARIGWAYTKQLSFSLLGQNLLNGAHEEFVSAVIPSTPVEISRSVFGKLTYSF